jgi:hypothetical protein
VDAELARELREAGVPEDELDDLTSLADELAHLPDATPRRAWQLESKWRLLRRYDQLRSERPDPER